MRNYKILDVEGKYTSGEYVGSRILTCVVVAGGCGLVTFGFYKISIFKFSSVLL